MNLEHPTKIVQLTAALIAIPVGLTAAFSFYHSHISTEGICENLRSSLLSIIDRNVPADVKFASMQRDFELFEQKCARIDPDIHTVFRATITHLQMPSHGRHSPAQQVDAIAIQASATTSNAVPHAQPGAIFGLSTSGERRGWVALSRRDTGHKGEPNFEGFAEGDNAPPPGARLSARRAIPVWLEPQIPGPNDPAMLQGRLGHGACVKVLATRAGAYRQWAQVSPVACP
jgi:hypothetical protein